MAWFGNVSLGNLDLAGAVNKLSESVKNIEKNFDSALGLEEKPATTSSEVSGIWPSASDRKTLFKPVMAFMGHRADENAEEASGTEESSKHASPTEEIAGVSVEESLVPAVKVIAPKEKEAEESKLQENSDHDMNLNLSPQLQESKLGVEAEVAAATEKPEDAAEAETEAATEAEPEVNSEADAETGTETEGKAESEGKTETEEKAKAVSEAKTEAEDEANLIQADSELSGVGNINVVDSPPIGQGEVGAEVGTPDGSQLDNRSDRVKQMEYNALHIADELPLTSDSEVSRDNQEQESEQLPDRVSLSQTDVLDGGSTSLSSDASGVVSSASHPESIIEVSSEPTFTCFEQSPDRETDSENKVDELSEPQEMGAQRNDLETAKQVHSRIIDVPSSVDSHIELDKVRKEMKLMEAALQGAARQAQSKADEIARLMNENEQLKSTIEDLKRKSSEAEVDVLRDEYHQKVAALERKVYALTRERDTLRREQSKKSDAAALLKEKDEIISQVMAEGEELSKKQAAQESTIRKLRAQIREFEEEKQRLNTKLQVEETKIESIRKDKAATEKLLQETIEKNQAELAAQKEFYINALNAAKEAEALAEARANNEARAELESRLREAGERESMLVQALEELRQTLSRTEQQAVFREDMLRRDIDDLQKRYQASELRYNELVTQVPESTRPLLRQIEAMQETAARRAEAWAGVERALNSRLQEAEAKAAAAEENERIMNERVSQSLSRITVLETQIACLRTEQAQLSRSLEKERQRASETRQEYLAAMEEAATQEGRAKQLEDEIKDLRSKHKRVLQEEMSKAELLEKELERERNAREELQKNNSRQIPRVGGQEHIPKRSYSINDNGNVPKRKLSSATSLGSMEESDFLQASLDSSDSFHSERRSMGETTMSPYFLKSMTPSAFEAALRQKDGELASYVSRLASLESIRDSLSEELVKMTEQSEKLRAEAAVLPGIRAELEALRRRHSSALELMGERDEALEELRNDIADLKEMYREQVDLLVNKIQVLSSSAGAA